MARVGKVTLGLDLAAAADILLLLRARDLIRILLAIATLAAVAA